MHQFLIALCIAVILIIFADAFEVMVLPRRINRRFRLAVFFTRWMWTLWRWVGKHLKQRKGREIFLSAFGPLSNIALLAFWTVLTIVCFGALHYLLEIKVNAPEGPPTFFTYVYMSGVTWFTLGFGDVVPVTPLGRALTVLEAGLGFGFLAVVIGYLPVIHGAFSERETIINLLDARAGSPPVASEYLLRLAKSGGPGVLTETLKEWERWGARVLETVFSFPVVAFYRSQHDNQSWLAAMTMMLDTCALLLASGKESCQYQASITFAMLRHAIVDVSLVMKASPRQGFDRSPVADFNEFVTAMAASGWQMRAGPAFDVQLAELRDTYEPFAHALADRLLMPIPPLAVARGRVDNWQTSAWQKKTKGVDQLSATDFTGPGVH